MSRAFRLKGHCNRLLAISQLPAHQRETFGGLIYFALRGERMRRVLFVTLFLLFGLYGYAHSSNNETTTPVKSGGLMCFTITPDSSETQFFTTCNDLCAKQGSACMGVTSALNPPQSCESPAQSETCRCCKVFP